mgnify:CR=1 FL=1
MEVKINLPLLPLRDIVVFPSMVIPLFVGRDKSISALNEVMKKEKKIILVTQKNAEVDDPKKNDIFSYGCEGNILQLLKLPDGTVKVLVEGIKRVKILEFVDNEKFITCDFSHQNDETTEEDLLPLALAATRRLEKLTSINKKISIETINSIKKLKNPSRFRRFRRRRAHQFDVSVVDVVPKRKLIRVILRRIDPLRGKGETRALVRHGGRVVPSLRVRLGVYF